MSFCSSPREAPEPASLDRAISLTTILPVSPIGVDCDAELIQAAEVAAGAPTKSSRVTQPLRRPLTVLSLPLDKVEVVKKEKNDKDQPPTKRKRTPARR